MRLSPSAVSARRAGTAICGVLAACALAAIAALAAASIPILPVPLAALLSGMAFGSATPGHGWPDLGMRISARSLLKASVALLAFRIEVDSVLELGLPGLVAMAGLVALTFLASLRSGRVARLSSDQAVLLGAGLSICGASAVVAVAASTKARDDDIASTVAIVTAVGTVVGITLSILASTPVLAFGDAEFGALVGASVHDVGQVVAAASARGTVAVDSALVVKMSRVAALIPLLLLVVREDAEADGSSRRLGALRRVPAFLWVFGVVVIANGFDLVPSLVQRAAGDAAAVLIAVALVGLGYGTRMGALLSNARPQVAVAGVVSTALVAGAYLLVASGVIHG